MPPRNRLSQEEKGKGVADSPSPIRDAQATDSPLDEFDLIHRDALRDSDNVTLSQRLLVADAHRMIRDDCAGRVEVGSGDEKFFESAQAIAAHSHLRWPDLSREWIRRQEARIARGFLLYSGPVSRVCPFIRKQQKLLDEARKMDGVPDLSALLKGNLQLLSKKSIPADVQGSTSSDADRASKEGAPNLNNEDVGAEPSASGPKKKKKSKKPRRKATEELPLEDIASLDETYEGREGAAEGPFESNRSEAAPEDRPRRKKKKRSIEAEPRPSDAEAGLVEVVAGGGVSLKTPPGERMVSARGSDPVASERSVPDPSTRKGSRSEGSTVRRGKIKFPDRVEFSYNETTPLILNPLRCTELTRQIRGGTKDMPQLDDLYFKNEYIDVASSRAWSDGSMNFLVEKYDSTLKQTMIQLGSSEKLAQVRLKVIERVRAEHKKANEKAAEEKEILRVKFEELEGKLKSARAARKELVRENNHLEQVAANLEKEKTELEKEVLRVKFEELEGKLKSAGAAKKELARENTRLEQATVTLEKEKAELLEERDAAVEKLIRERQRLRDSRGLEVTRERERVEAAMIEKANSCFGRMRDHLTRLDAFGKTENLYGQASGTRKCLEMIKASLERRLIGPGMVSQLITSLEITEEPLEEPLVAVTSVPAERIEVLEGGGPSERSGNENLEEVPGKDNL
ncbi:hypothetical protein F2Q69_00008580 [Brassica cretica]|uniref:DUF1204 domain-containing protein n=1 Tax=Brassica cretica TaxID=69181 RepID=A0A8S9P662_BRACR|nr:hypothetical protein F2Q69_00008580 [Brassica cretica]